MLGRQHFDQLLLARRAALGSLEGRQVLLVLLIVDTDADDVA